MSGIATTEYLIDAITYLRQLCWSEAGVNRSLGGMQKALNSIRKDFENLTSQPLLELMNNQPKDLCTRLVEFSRRDLNLLLDLSNRQLATSLLFEACLFRRESRGGHFRTDFPKALPYWQCHSRQKFGESISTRPVKS